MDGPRPATSVKSSGSSPGSGGPAQTTGGPAPTGSFRKPLQAFSSMRPRPTTSFPRVTDSVQFPPDAPEPLREPAQSTSGSTREPDRISDQDIRLMTPREPSRFSRPDIKIEAPNPAEPSPAPVVPADIPPILVKSPTGLILKFPFTDLLASWASIIENPGPYLVCRGNDEWRGLPEFLAVQKPGAGHVTASFRRIQAESQGALSSISEDSPAIDAGPISTSPVPAGATRPTRPPSSTGTKPGMPQLRTPTTSQFKFKIVEKREPGSRKWIVIGVVAGGVLVGLGVAAYLMGFV
jgi:hypothetical protein